MFLYLFQSLIAITQSLNDLMTCGQSNSITIEADALNTTKSLDISLTTQ